MADFLQKLYEEYKITICKNAATIGQFESAFRIFSYVIAGRFFIFFFWALDLPLAYILDIESRLDLEKILRSRSRSDPVMTRSRGIDLTQ